MAKSKEAKCRTTPAKKVVKAEKNNNKFTIDLGRKVDDKFDKAHVESMINTLMAVHKARNKENSKKDLFTDDGEPIYIQVAGIKLPKDGRQQLVKVKLPHCCMADAKDVCLVVKDLKKGLNVDHEPTVGHFKSLLADKGVDVASLISLRELKVEYKAFEAKTALCHRHEAFFVDERIVRLVPKFLGKAFYKRKKFPIAVDLTKVNLKEEFAGACRTSIWPLNHHGTCSMFQVGHTGMAKEKLVDNIAEAEAVIKKRYPGGWDNVRCIHLKASTSPALPVHVSLKSANELGFVDADKPVGAARQPVTDELSTLMDAKVTVMPNGHVRVIRRNGQDFVDDDDEPFEDGSSGAEDNSDNDEGDEKAAKQPGKDRAKTLKRKAQKSVDSGDSSDEEDDIVEAENEYLQKLNDEQEEEKDNVEETKKGTPAKKAKKNKVAKKDGIAASKPANKTKKSKVEKSPKPVKNVKMPKEDKNADNVEKCEKKSPAKKVKKAKSTEDVKPKDGGKKEKPAAKEVKKAKITEDVKPKDGGKKEKPAAKKAKTGDKKSPKPNKSAAKRK